MIITQINFSHNSKILKKPLFLPILSVGQDVDVNWLKLKNPRLVYTERSSHTNSQTHESRPVRQLDEVLNDSADSPIVHRTEKKSKNHSKTVDILDTKKNKVKIKKKLRTKIHINEDDDNLESNYTNSSKQDKSLELSVMRPPKTFKTKTVIKKSCVANTSKNTKNLNKTIDFNNIKSVDSQLKKSISIFSPITIQELGSLLALPEAEIIKWLFLQSISVTINQMIDIPIAKSVAEHYGFTLDDNLIADKNILARDMNQEHDDPELRIKRSPIVTIFGHVDHGKTTLLDTIRRINHSTIEAGGITQAIAAYEVSIEESHTKVREEVIFLDTPGHEAFAAMRVRGAKVTDIGILVVAADDSLQPQSIEAIKHLTDNELPFIVAINKIDKSGTNISKVKEELAKHGVLGKDWGGGVPIIEVSGLANINIDALLDQILLQAEMQNLQANPSMAATGTILDASLDRTRGPIAHILVQNGTIKVGDYLIADTYISKIRAIISRQGEKINKAGPSSVIEVWGLVTVPKSGSLFEIAYDEKSAKKLLLEQSFKTQPIHSTQNKLNRRVTLDSSNRQKNNSSTKQVNLILKTDAQSSIEAIVDAFANIPQAKVQLNLVFIGVGEIRESDIQLASVTQSAIISFNSVVTNQIKMLADQYKTSINEFSVIYDIIDYIKDSMLDLVDIEYAENIIGSAEVETVFTLSKGSVAGCTVLSGKLKHNASIRVLRDGKIYYNGALDSLKRVKEDIAEIGVGNECGVLSDNFNSWQKKDVIEAYELIPKTKEL
jgi:translation initiation factor IF-2